MLCLLKIYLPLNVLQYSFVARQTDFTCLTATNQSLASTCPEDRVSQCASLHYEQDTIIAEWDLVCDQNWLSKMTMSCLMLGRSALSNSTRRNMKIFQDACWVPWCWAGWRTR